MLRNVYIPVSLATMDWSCKHQGFVVQTYCENIDSVIATRRDVLVYGVTCRGQRPLKHDSFVSSKDTPKGNVFKHFPQLKKELKE